MRGHVAIESIVEGFIRWEIMGNAERISYLKRGDERRGECDENKTNVGGKNERSNGGNISWLVQ